jgi:hypothetical protein
MSTGDQPLNQKYGNELRNSILPREAPTGISFTGPPYDPSDELVLPGQIGVRDEGSLDATIDAVKGVAFYADMIGFGAPSNNFTRGMAVKPYPLGVNYFIKTAQKCSNGEKMYEYVEGIPKGDALGRRMKAALEGMGYPPLKGMGPAMIEDVKDALNPKPIIRTLFGSAYPRCKQVSKRVGSSLNRLYALDENGQLDKARPIVEDPDNVEYTGANEYGPVPHQIRWVLDKYIDRETYEAERAASAAAISKGGSEGFFASSGSQATKQAVLGTIAAILTVVAVAAYKARK